MIGNGLKKVIAQNPSVPTKSPRVFNIRRPTENKVKYARKATILRCLECKEIEFILWDFVFILQSYTGKIKAIIFSTSNTVHSKCYATLFQLFLYTVLKIIQMLCPSICPCRYKVKRALPLSQHTSLHTST